MGYVNCGATAVLVMAELSMFSASSLKAAQTCLVNGLSVILLYSMMLFDMASL